MWQKLAAAGLQRFKDRREIKARQKLLERALSELCRTISSEIGDWETSGLERARAFRSKPITGGKSHYECINQLIHYWYCCVAADHLLRLGFTDLEVRPTGHDNATDLGDEDGESGPYDIRADHGKLGRLVGEVFCVSEALWPQKMSKTRLKLGKSRAAIRAVFYNEEAKPTYRPKMERLIAFGVKKISYEVIEIASTVEAWNRMATRR